MTSPAVSDTLIKPIFLLADSQPLFWHEGDQPFMDRVRRLLAGDEAEGAPRAAYLGASNGDRREFYDIFLAAMEAIGVRDCRLVRSYPEREDWEFLDRADLVLLAGGDTERGWKVFRENGFVEKLIERYYMGSVLMGVSAGAIQLGLMGTSGDDPESLRFFDTLRLVPLVVDVHDEPSWTRLHRAVLQTGEHGRGIGIPTGGAAVIHPDLTVEPVRHSLTELSVTEEGLKQALLFPPGPGSEGEEEAAPAGEAAPN